MQGVGRVNNLLSKDHLFSMFAKFSRKNSHFLPPDRHMYACVSWGKKCNFFRKIFEYVLNQGSHTYL